MFICWRCPDRGRDHPAQPAPPSPAQPSPAQPSARLTAAVICIISYSNWSRPATSHRQSSPIVTSIFTMFREIGLPAHSPRRKHIQFRQLALKSPPLGPKWGRWAKKTQVRIRSSSLQSASMGGSDSHPSFFRPPIPLRP